MSAPLSPEAMTAIQAAAALGLSSLRADAPQTLSEWGACPNFCVNGSDFN